MPGLGVAGKGLGSSECELKLVRTADHQASILAKPPRLRLAGEPKSEAVDETRSSPVATVLGGISMVGLGWETGVDGGT